MIEEVRTKFLVSFPKFFVKHPNLTLDCGDIIYSDKFQNLTRHWKARFIP